MGLQVADLFATLGLKTDEGAFRRADKLIEGVKHGLEAFIGFEVVRKLGEAITSTIELGSNLNDTAQKTGLAVEALQEYGYIAKQNSSSTEEFSHAVVKLSRGLDEAAVKGSGPAADALKRLGISLNDPKFKSATLDDKITLIARQLGKLPDGTKKTALAMDLFGRSGAELIPTLNDIAEHGGELRQEFRDMGGELSGEDAGGLDKLGDSLDKAKAQLGALKNQVIVALVPALQSMVEGLMEWVKANKELISSAIRTVIDGLVLGFKALAVVVEIAAHAIDFLREHGELARAILIAIGVVLGVLAVEAAAAWIAATAPILIVIAAIAGIILVLQDLVKALLEGKGVIHTVLSAIADKFRSIYHAIRGVFESIGSFFAGIASSVKSAFVAVIDWITDKIDWAWTQVKRIAHIVAHPIQSAEDFFSGDDTGDGPITSPSQVATRSMQGAMSAPVTNVDARASITVNANGTDPQGVVDIANKQIAAHHEQTWRDVDAATGGSDEP